MDNVMKIEFSALAENEAFARSVAAAFVMPLAEKYATNFLLIVLFSFYE